MELRHFHGLVALQDIELADLLFHFRIHIIQQVIGLQHAGIHLKQRIFADEGVNDGLPDAG